MWRRRRRKSFARRLIDGLTTVTLLATVAVAVALLDQHNTQQLEGRFEVVDGDSLRLNGRELRLVGIDAPEFRQECIRGGQGWACGRAARDHLHDLMAQNAVTCEGHETDKFDRLLVQCNADGMQINRQMVLDGFALSFGAHQDAERIAQAEQKGLWASEFVRPSDWRDVHMGGVLEARHGRGLRDYIRAGTNWVRSLWPSDNP